LSVNLQAAETDLSGGGERVAKVFESVDELKSGLVVLDAVDDLLKLLLQFTGILLPLLVLGEEGLTVIVEGRGLLVSRVGGDVSGLVEESVEVALKLFEVFAEFVVVLDVLASLQ
jgi:hypothetical protein